MPKLSLSKLNHLNLISGSSTKQLYIYIKVAIKRAMTSTNMDSEISQIMEMGFTREDAIIALNNTNHNVMKAVEYILNPPESLPEYEHTEKTFLELSDNDSDVMITKIEGQESGTFGPATRDFYDSQEWGLVTTTPQPESPVTTSQQVQPPVRVRRSDEFPLLYGNNWVAPLLVVLHKIPIAREALINFGSSLEESGSAGTVTAASAETVTNESSGKLSPGPVTGIQRNEEDTETQVVFENDWYKSGSLGVDRAMAFLDGKSRRAYAQYDAPQGTADLGELLISVGSGKVFESRVVQDSEEQENGAVKLEETVVAHFDLTSTDSDADLYDLIGGADENAYFEDVAEVLCMSVNTGVKASAEFYPDRYRKDAWKLVLQARQKVEEIEELIVKKNQERFGIVGYLGKDVSKMVTISSEYLNELVSTFKEEDSGKSDLVAAERAAADLERVKNEFLAKKTQLSDEINDLQARARMLRQLFKGEAENKVLFNKEFPGSKYPSVMRKYTLCGVILGPDDYFFLTPSSSNSSFMPESLELDKSLEAEEISKSTSSLSSTVQNQGERNWRRVTNLTTLPDNVPESTVLSSVSTTTMPVTLIYASATESFAAIHEVELPDRLKVFVEEDLKSVTRSVRASSNTNMNVNIGTNINPTNASADSSSISVTTATVPGESSSVSVKQINENEDEDEDVEMETGLMNDQDANAMELEFKKAI